jgi:predicted transposase/invertase (TIGR01784 family)
MTLHSPPPPRFLSPGLDIVFRRLLIDNPPLLRAMLTAVLRPESPITETVLLPAQPEGGLALAKDIVLDVRVGLRDGSQIDVEMQSRAPAGTRERILLYWSRMFGASFERGQGYIDAPRCVSIIWSGQPLLPHPEFHRRITLRDGGGRSFTDVLEFHVLELAHLGLAEVETENADVIRWAKFLLARNEGEIHDLAREDMVMSEAERSLLKLSDFPGFVSEAQQRADALMFSEIFLRRARRDGLVEGRAEGHAEGLADGLARGQAEGRALLFLELLEQRFPGLPPDARARVERASPEEITTWTRRLLTAETIADLLDGR